MGTSEQHAAPGEPRRESNSRNALVDEAIAGDRRALEALWRSHRRWVAGILLAHRPANEDLEDLLQEVALTLVRKIAELREPSSFRAWLRTVAMNVARAAGRRVALRRRNAEVDDTGALDEVESRAGPSLGDETEIVLAAIADLPPEYREPLVLRCVHGHGQREIARALGLPETTVETRLARARRRLRETLAQSGITPSTGRSD